MGAPSTRLLATQLFEGDCPYRFGIRAPFLSGFGYSLRRGPSPAFAVSLPARRPMVYRSGRNLPTDCFDTPFGIGLALQPSALGTDSSVGVQHPASNFLQIVCEPLLESVRGNAHVFRNFVPRFVEGPAVEAFLRQIVHFVYRSLQLQRILKRCRPGPVLSLL